jgi:hypothetical protein
LINTLLGKVFGTKNEREVKRLQPRVAAINALEPEMQKLSDDQLRAKTDEFRARIQERLSSIADEPAESDLPDIDRQKEIEAERDARCSRWFSTNCSKRPLPWSAKPDGACSTCATSTCN